MIYIALFVLIGISLFLVIIGIYWVLSHKQPESEPALKPQNEVVKSGQTKSMPRILPKNQSPQTETITMEARDFIRAANKASLNILFAGSTEIGALAFIKTLFEDIPVSNPILVIEDAADMEMLMTSAGGVIAYAGALTNCGHVLSHLESLYQEVGGRLSTQDMRMQMTLKVDLICTFAHVDKHLDQVITITEVQGLEAETIVLMDVFFIEEGSNKLKPIGLRPKCLDRIEAAGITVPATIFSPK